jgi:hypothetical protein
MGMTFAPAVGVIRGSRHHKKTLATLAVKARDAIATLMAPAQIAEARKLAREWKSKR